MYISTSHEHWINTKYVHFNTCHVLISTNHEHKTLHIHYNSKHDQEFVFKKTVFANNAIFSKIMSQSKDFFWLIQAPNISKHISRNGGATIKASRKTAHDKVLFILGQKGHFSPKNYGTMKIVTALNLYVGTNVLMYERRLMGKVWSM